VQVNVLPWEVGGAVSLAIYGSYSFPRKLNQRLETRLNTEIDQVSIYDSIFKFKVQFIFKMCLFKYLQFPVMLFFL
jgi:hypothetical protein